MAPSLNIPKLKDADLAGSDSSESCSLILTEGDSATLFIQAGLKFLEQDKVGVFPLKGMFLNVRDNPTKAKQNREVKGIKKILGLEYDKVYTDVKGLRYGHLVIMTDQDHPGNHIKGLILNMFDFLWPSLLQVNGFIQMFVTPIITASQVQTKEPKSFYTMSEFYEWQSGNDVTDYDINYRKGLATFSDKEAVEYFKSFQDNIRHFEWIDENDNNAIKLAFCGEDAEKKRKWLREENQASTICYSKGKSIRYLDFINNVVRQALLDVVHRTIPSIMDGLKRSQRKVMHCAIEYPEIQKTKVSVEQFSALVAKDTFYRHGEQNLHGVMIGLAQDFVGSNNINLLQPDGLYGSRVQGPSIHGSGRYVKTSLSPVVLYIYRKEDKLILNYLYDGGKYIEPSRFYPIIPVILVNGCDVIAPGWRSFIPCYNPRVIIANLRHLLDNQEVLPMLAWYRGFSGYIRETETGYLTEGKFSEENDGIRITELPVKTWNKKYETTLNRLKVKKAIESYRARHSNSNDVRYEIEMSEAQMKKAKKPRGGLLNTFKLTTKLSTANMNLIDENGIIKKYDTPRQILEHFFYFRLECYKWRKEALLCELKKASLVLESTKKYLRELLDGTIGVFGLKSKKFTVLREKGYKTLPSITKMAADWVQGKQTETETEEVADIPKTGYDYLLSISIGSLGEETLEELEDVMDKAKKELDDLIGKSPEELWISDLDELTKQLDVLDL